MTGGSTRMDQPTLDAMVAELVERHRLPGMTVGLLDGQQITLSAAGVRNAFTDDQATADTLFQIGSLTKMYTATLIMQLVYEGGVSLDDPITRHLPELHLLGDPDLSAITIRSLVTHTSGIEGDSFFDTGRGDDAVERIIPRLEAIGLIHAPGDQWSYCNTGFVLAGRIVEKVTGLPWHRALTTRLVQPLGVATPITLLDDVLPYRVATGHVGSPDDWQPAPLATMPWSQAPAGSRSFGRVADLRAFAAMHCDDGMAAHGTRVLSADSTRLMQSHLADQPLSMTKGQGIGWFLLDEEPELVVGHAGDTAGFSALLLVAPRRRLAVASLVNTSNGVGANFEAAFRLFAEVGGISVSAPGSVPPGQPAPHMTNVIGEYARAGQTASVRLADDGSSLLVELTDEDELRGRRVETLRLVHASGPVFVDAADPGSLPFEFTLPEGEGDATYFIVGARVLRRVG